MQKKSKVKRPLAKANWRNTPDAVLLALTPSRVSTRAQSLHPNADTMWAYALGEPLSRAAIDCWAFHAPVTVVTL
jgi:hypothetical protein